MKTETSGKPMIPNNGQPPPNLRGLFEHIDSDHPHPNDKGNQVYHTLLQAAGSHIAAQVAGTYALANGNPAAVSGTGILYPIASLYIAAADLPSVNGVTPKLRIRGEVYNNDVAAFTGTLILGLYPITRPGTSGGAGLNIYTLGTVVSGSQVTLTNPAADSANALVGSDFAMPADGHYCLGFITNATVAASAHLHIAARLQHRN
ncbi:hypothetical protein UFOVP1326_37 [uncultured Caudovirales phage]|uniref:Uncharacterized protein n=1 Tax=uncultured Caudovirales phage TaxID=2100421 RepID=A0A6J5SES0_9CAUD|nr:hypothetical protein UFOVP1326_37 [uncultured Caudovirales phage]CAB4212317.1 hypothetical protein UFOVP1436_2 [uncultured Caudovirales phage]